jgi:hypothetical protein
LDALLKKGLAGETEKQGFKVSGFQGFRVGSKFQGFKVSLEARDISVGMTLDFFL